MSTAKQEGHRRLGAIRSGSRAPQLTRALATASAAWERFCLDADLTILSERKPSRADEDRRAPIGLSDEDFGVQSPKVAGVFALGS